jgi:hypothetical protein
MRELVASFMFLGLLAAGTRAEAATVVINVNSVASLYQAFVTADATPANVYEVRLAAGTYRLSCPPSGDTQATSGSLKLTRGSVTLIGADADENAAANFVIDGGWSGTSGCSSFFKVGAAGPNATVFPTLDVRGVTLQNGNNTSALFAPIDLQYATFSLSASRVRHTRARHNVFAGGAIYARDARVTISRSYIEDATTEDATIVGGCGGGVFAWGGAIYFGDDGVSSNRPASILVISQSTIRTSKGCRGGAVVYNSSPLSRFFLLDSTIAENTAVISGGGLYLAGPGQAQIYGNTIAKNNAATPDDDPTHRIERIGGGIAFFQFSGALAIRGNIVARNTVVHPEFADGSPANGSDDCFFARTAPSSINASFNLLGKQGNCSFAVGPLVGTNNAPLNPRLGPLESVPMVSWSGTMPMFNGLMPGSPAIIANGGACQAQDQRGASRRPTSCDLGAYNTGCGHDPCRTGSTLGPSCGACVELICNLDNFCCTSEWDGICVGEVNSMCGLSCQ